MVGDWGGTTFWQIGNLKDPPHMNGWCYTEHIYGVFFEVSGIQPASGPYVRRHRSCVVLPGCTSPGQQQRCIDQNYGWHVITIAQ